ncbi:serine hydrolase domain-containing protein [Halpernia sp.]|uniref:serine hydrolase domain-containing protein n=1 Tax=Halpernia sp. TaxID=2782209 RepID=UPI003A912E87
MLYRNFLLLCLAFSLTSCKKNSDSDKNSYQTTLPNFGNVDVDKIFTEQNIKIQNEDSVKKTIQNYYEKVWEKGNLSGGLLVAKGNKIIFEDYRGFGRENEQMPINENTPLHVASVSKTLTAMATMKLVEGGLLKLDDHLTKFFPKFPYPQVTVFNLLTQRSGLPKYEYFIERIKPEPTELSKKYLTNQDVLNLLEKYKPELAKPVNSGFMYCNTNFALLALILEKVTKTPFPQAMQEIIFKPLKMDHTYIFQEKDTATAAQSFFNGGNKLYPLDRLDLIYGDKNVYTTPRDLLNFSKALFAKNFLREDLMRLVFEPHSNENPGINNYGVGFRMKIFDNGEKLTYHNGWWHGSNAVFAHLLKSNVTIVAIGNKYSQRVYSALALSSLFEDFPYEKEKLLKVTTPKDSLKNSVDESSE